MRGLPLDVTVIEDSNFVITHQVYRIQQYGFCSMCSEFYENRVALGNSQEEVDSRYGGEDIETGALCSDCMVDLLSENPYTIAIERNQFY